MTSEPRRERTLVAFYGDKPPALARMITQCQSALHERLGDAFAPYAMAQVHATIIGLERADSSNELNRNFLKHRGIEAAMNIPAFAAFLERCHQLPFTVQFGGFQAHERPFLSRGATPYTRSFTLQGDKAVLMGWPVASELDELRKAAQPFGILHAYHRSADNVDNDFYMRLGMVHGSAIGEALREETGSTMRRQLADTAPLHIEVTAQSLSFIEYEDAELPISSSRAFRISEI